MFSNRIMFIIMFSTDFNQLIVEAVSKRELPIKK